MLSEIETDCDSLHGRKLLSVWRSPTTTLWHINAGKRGAVHPIKTNPGGPAVRDGYGGAAQRRRNLPPPLATTCSSHPSDFLKLAVMIPKSGVLDSGGTLASDDDANSATRARHGRNLHFVQRPRRKMCTISPAPGLPRDIASLVLDYLLSGPPAVCSAGIFAIPNYRTPTDITPKKTLRPFDSIDGRVRSITRGGNVAPICRYREDSSPIRENGAADLTCAPLKNDNSWHRLSIVDWPDPGIHVAAGQDSLAQPSPPLAPRGKQILVGCRLEFR